MKDSVLRTLRSIVVATTLAITLSAGAVYTYVILAFAMAPGAHH